MRRYKLGIEQSEAERQRGRRKEAETCVHEQSASVCHKSVLLVLLLLGGTQVTDDTAHT